MLFLQSIFLVFCLIKFNCINVAMYSSLINLKTVDWPLLTTNSF